MSIKIERNNYDKVIPLINQKNEISVYSVLAGLIPGEVYVNDIKNPTSALIKTCECNLLAGYSKDSVFNSSISSELDFWDPVTPDSDEWIDVIPKIHENKFIKMYTRRRYELYKDNWKDETYTMLNGYTLEPVNLSELRKKQYRNSNKIFEWVEDWGSDETFSKYGAGYYIRNEEEIVSWSLSDCYYDDKITIGVHTSENFRQMGFGKRVANATIKAAFDKGYTSINWLCVDFNKGSIAIAEKLGFKFANHYFSFSSYPPCENPKDLSESEWKKWGQYFENASHTEPRLLLEQLYSYIKSNDVYKSIETIQYFSKANKSLDMNEIKQVVKYFQSFGLCSNFNNNEWNNFITLNSSD